MKLLSIEWEDAGTLSLGDWRTRSELEEDAARPHLNRTVGWLVREDADALVVAAQMTQGDEPQRFDLVMRIPKVLIRKRKVIRP